MRCGVTSLTCFYGQHNWKLIPKSNANKHKINPFELKIDTFNLIFSMMNSNQKHVCRHLIGLLLLNIFLLPAVSEEVPFFDRLKQARFPYSYVVFEKLDVADGKELEYLELEKKWLAIHNIMAKRGKILSWGLAKARTNSLGYEYVSWKTFRSLKDLEMVYNWAELGNLVGNEKLNDLLKKTGETRTIIGTQVLKLRDCSMIPLNDMSRLAQLKPSDLFIRVKFMEPKKGKMENFLKIVDEGLSPLYQKFTEANKKFFSWEFQELLFHKGKGSRESFRAFEIKRNDTSGGISKKERSKIENGIGPWPGTISPRESIKKLAKIDTVYFDVVYLTSGNAEATVRNNLQGIWTHTNPDGSFRTKVMTHYTEQLSFYHSDGKLIYARPTMPFRIEVSDKLTRFTVFQPDGSTWHASMQLHDGKWYEQDRNLSYTNDHGKTPPPAPNAYYIYSRSSNP